MLCMRVRVCQGVGGKDMTHFLGRWAPLLRNGTKNTFFLGSLAFKWCFFFPFFFSYLNLNINPPTKINLPFFFNIIFLILSKNIFFRLCFLKFFFFSLTSFRIKKHFLYFFFISFLILNRLFFFSFVKFFQTKNGDLSKKNI